MDSRSAGGAAARLQLQHFGGAGSRSFFRRTVESLHTSLLTSCILGDTSSLMRSHPDDESLQLGLLMTCEGLSKSRSLFSPP